MSKRKRSPIGDLRQPLGEDDEALWAQAAESIEPLKRAKPRHVALPEPATDAPVKPPPARAKTEALQIRSSPPSAARIPPAAPATAPVHVERRKVRQLGSGRVSIDARIDLHGMRQSEAHTALRRFLLAAQAEGYRWVLVITGKGAPETRGSEEARGVLRRNVPRWLAEPDLRAIVVSFTTAGVRHGGDGALYVQVRSRQRAGGT